VRTDTVPPCAATSPETIASPRPVPGLVSAVEPLEDPLRLVAFHARSVVLDVEHNSGRGVIQHA
jgi:hypothetical protein